MKRSRMIVSVILVIAFMLSTFLIPVSAAVIEDSTVEPQAAMLWCPECDRLTARYVSSELEVIDEWTTYKCFFTTGPSHRHEIHHTYDVLQCQNCGFVEDDIRDRDYCALYTIYVPE